MLRMLSIVCGTLLALTGHAAEFTREQLKALLAEAPAAKPLDLLRRALDGLDLHRLELAGVDFSGANLTRVNFYAARVQGAKLVGANLTGATLNLAWVMRAGFTGADLSNAVLQSLVTSTGLDTSRAEAPIFARTKFTVR